MITISQTFITKFGRVSLSFAWVDGTLRTKCTGVTDLDHSFISEIKYDLELVPVKEGKLGLPFVGDDGPVWLQCSAAVQEALSQVDWEVVKIMLLARAQQQLIDEGKELEREIRKLAKQREEQLHTRGTLQVYQWR
jgi:predicted heme/steroid binding protein